MNLLVHADPGARANLLAAWLLDLVNQDFFDVGSECEVKLAKMYVKLHRVQDQSLVSGFQGTKIRIRPTLSGIDLQSLLFLRKNVYKIYPDFTRDEYSLECFSKLSVYANEVLQWDKDIDNSVYDYVIDFDHTFDLAVMTDLYQKIHNRTPTRSSMNFLRRSNVRNWLPLDKNHCCSLLKEILIRESRFGFYERDRLWSIVDIFNNVAEHLRMYHVISCIKRSNYRQCHEPYINTYNTPGFAS